MSTSIKHPSGLKCVTGQAGDRNQLITSDDGQEPTRSTSAQSLLFSEQKQNAEEWAEQQMFLRKAFIKEPVVYVIDDSKESEVSLPQERKAEDAETLRSPLASSDLSSPVTSVTNTFSMRNESFVKLVATLPSVKSVVLGVVSILIAFIVLCQIVIFLETGQEEGESLVLYVPKPWPSAEPAHAFVSDIMNTQLQLVKQAGISISEWFWTSIKASFLFMLLYAVLSAIWLAVAVRFR